jgi:hypothetical protein
VPSTIKSYNTLLSEIITFLKAYNRSLDTGATSLSRDLVVTPYSVGARLLMEQVGIARQLYILGRLRGNYLDNEATNYTLERSTGTYASVMLTFWTETRPTADITIAAGTQVRTAGTSFTSPVIFSTVSETTYALSAVDSYYSYDRARYEFQVSALARIIGETGNVGAGLINLISSAIPQISGVTNISASYGGTGVEDDDDFRERIRLKKIGVNINTVNGLREFTRERGFIDAYPVRVENSDAERATGVDVFVIDQDVVSITDTFTYYTGIPRYYFSIPPVTAVTSVVSATVGTLSSSDYDVNIDNSSPLRRSTLAQDYIEIRASASLPEASTFTVTYTYSQTIVNFQSNLELDQNDILTADPLVKRAYPLSFYINAVLTLTANADGPTNRSRARNALIQFLAQYRLGEDIQKSDIIIVLQQGYGDFPIAEVDAVVINEYYLEDEFGATYLPIDETITVSDKQYAIHGTATIT